MQNLKINLIVGLLLVAGSGLALESDRNAKIVIQGPGCVSKLKLNQTECKQGMTIEQGTMLIKSTYGMIYHKTKGVERVEMTGDQVYMEQKMDDGDKMIIKANQIDYVKAEDKVYLKGNVSIASSIGVTTGDEIEFDLNSQEMTAIGNEATQQFKMEIEQNND